MNQRNIQKTAAKPVVETQAAVGTGPDGADAPAIGLRTAAKVTCPDVKVKVEYWRYLGDIDPKSGLRPSGPVRSEEATLSWEKGWKALLGGVTDQKGDFTAMGPEYLVDGVEECKITNLVGFTKDGVDLPMGDFIGEFSEMTAWDRFSVDTNPRVARNRELIKSLTYYQDDPIPALLATVAEKIAEKDGFLLGQGDNIGWRKLPDERFGRFLQIGGSHGEYKGIKLWLELEDSLDSGDEDQGFRVCARVSDGVDRTLVVPGFPVLPEQAFTNDEKALRDQTQALFAGPRLDEALKALRDYAQTKGLDREYKVNLKWAAWSADIGSWTERGHGDVIDALETLRVGEVLRVKSAPKKETRYGSVNVTRREDGGYRAEGLFSSSWDSSHDLLNTLELDKGSEKKQDSAHDWLREILPFETGGEDPGVQFEFVVEADSLEGLFEIVDEQEAELIRRDKEAWREVKESVYWAKKATKGTEVGAFTAAWGIHVSLDHEREGDGGLYVHAENQGVSKWQMPLQKNGQIPTAEKVVLDIAKRLASLPEDRIADLRKVFDVEALEKAYKADLDAAAAKAAEKK